MSPLGRVDAAILHDVIEERAVPAGCFAGHGIEAVAAGLPALVIILGAKEPAAPGAGIPVGLADMCAAGGTGEHLARVVLLIDDRPVVGRRDVDAADDDGILNIDAGRRIWGRRLLLLDEPGAAVRTKPDRFGKPLFALGTLFHEAFQTGRRHAVGPAAGAG